MVLKHSLTSEIFLTMLNKVRRSRISFRWVLELLQLFPINIRRFTDAWKFVKLYDFFWTFKKIRKVLWAFRNLREDFEKVSDVFRTITNVLQNYFRTDSEHFPIKKSGIRKTSEENSAKWERGLSILSIVLVTPSVFTTSTELCSSWQNDLI